METLSIAVSPLPLHVLVVSLEPHTHPRCTESWVDGIHRVVLFVCSSQDLVLYFWPPSIRLNTQGGTVLVCPILSSPLPFPSTPPHSPSNSEEEHYLVNTTEFPGAPRP